MGKTIKYNDILECGHEVDITVTSYDSTNRDNELCELQDDKQILWEVRVRIGNHKKGES